MKWYGPQAGELVVRLLADDGDHVSIGVLERGSLRLPGGPGLKLVLANSSGVRGIDRQVSVQLRFRRYLRSPSVLRSRAG